ncbi:unnamed protein product, partial [Mesorhabditis spiculigera]
MFATSELSCHLRSVVLDHLGFIDLIALLRVNKIFRTDAIRRALMPHKVMKLVINARIYRPDGVHDPWNPIDGEANEHKIRVRETALWIVDRQRTALYYPLYVDVHRIFLIPDAPPRLLVRSLPPHREYKCDVPFAEFLKFLHRVRCPKELWVVLREDWEQPSSRAQLIKFQLTPFFRQISAVDCLTISVEDPVTLTKIQGGYWGNATRLRFMDAAETLLRWNPLLAVNQGATGPALHGIDLGSGRNDITLSGFSREQQLWELVELGVRAEPACCLGRLLEINTQRRLATADPNEHADLLMERLAAQLSREHGGAVAAIQKGAPELQKLQHWMNKRRPMYRDHPLQRYFEVQVFQKRMLLAFTYQSSIVPEPHGNICLCFFEIAPTR